MNGHQHTRRVGTIVLPVLSQHLIAGFGWRGAYQILAGISLVGAVIAFTLLRERQGYAKTSRTHDSGEFATDASISARLKLLRIVVIFLAAFLASSAALSLGPHLPALLIDRGIPAQDATRSASLVGLGILIGRLASGRTGGSRACAARGVRVLRRRRAWVRLVEATR